MYYACVAKQSWQDTYKHWGKTDKKMFSLLLVTPRTGPSLGSRNEKHLSRASTVVQALAGRGVPMCLSEWPVGGTQSVSDTLGVYSDPSATHRTPRGLIRIPPSVPDRTRCGNLIPSCKAFEAFPEEAELLRTWCFSACGHCQWKVCFFSCDTIHAVRFVRCRSQIAWHCNILSHVIYYFW